MLVIVSSVTRGFAVDPDQRATDAQPFGELTSGESRQVLPEVTRPYDFESEGSRAFTATSQESDFDLLASQSSSVDSVPPPPEPDTDDAPRMTLKALSEDNPSESKSIETPPIETPLIEPQPVDDTNGLDVDELVAIALSQHPAIQQAKAAVEKARGLQYQSGRKFNPTVGYMASEVGNEGNFGQQGIFVGQTFVRGNKLHLNTHIYGSEIDRVTHGVQLESLRLTRQVRERYFELVYSRRRAQVLQRLVKLSQKSVAMAEARYAADEVSQSQVLQSTLETQQISLALRQARVKTKTAELRLANVMGVPDYDVTGRVSPPADPPTQLSREALWEEIRTKSPELAMARANKSKASWVIQRGRVQSIGNVETQFSLQFDDSTNYTVAGIQVGVPIAVNDHNRGNIQSAEADYLRACHEEKRVRIALRDRLMAAFQDYEVALQSRSAAADEMLPIARRNLELTTDRYDIGEAEFTELLLAQRIYLKVSLSLLDSDFQIWGVITAFDQLLVTSSFETPTNAESSDAAAR